MARAFLGSSFAYLGGFSAVAELDSGIYAGMTGEDPFSLVLGRTDSPGAKKETITENGDCPGQEKQDG